MRLNSMATRPNKIPFAANVNATGKPSSKNKTRLANMIGARLLTINSMTTDPLCQNPYASQHRQAPSREFLRPEFLRPYVLPGEPADQALPPPRTQYI